MSDADFESYTGPPSPSRGSGGSGGSSTTFTLGSMVPPGVYAGWLWISYLSKWGFCLILFLILVVTAKELFCIGCGCKVVGEWVGKRIYWLLCRLITLEPLSGHHGRIFKGGGWPPSIASKLPYPRGMRVRLGGNHDGEAIVTGYGKQLGMYVVRLGTQTGAASGLDDLEPEIIPPMVLMQAINNPPPTVSRVLPASIDPLPDIDEDGMDVRAMELIEKRPRGGGVEVAKTRTVDVTPMMSDGTTDKTDAKARVVDGVTAPGGVSVSTPGSTELEAKMSQIEKMLGGMLAAMDKDGSPPKKMKTVLFPGAIDTADEKVRRRLQEAVDVGEDLDSDDVEEILDDSDGGGGVGLLDGGLLNMTPGDLGRGVLALKPDGLSRKEHNKAQVAKALRTLPSSVRKQINYQDCDAPGSIWKEVVDEVGPDFIEKIAKMKGASSPNLKACLTSGGSALQIIAGVARANKEEWQKLSTTARTQLSVAMDLLGGMVQYGTSTLAGDFNHKVRRQFLLTGTAPSFVGSHRGRRAFKKSAANLKMNVGSDGELEGGPESVNDPGPDHT